MSLAHTYNRELREIENTKFWVDYINFIHDAKQRYVTKLQKEPIGEPTVRGVVWQDNIKLLDEILALPNKILALAEGKNL